MRRMYGFRGRSGLGKLCAEVFYGAGTGLVPRSVDGVVAGALSVVEYWSDSRRLHETGVGSVFDPRKESTRVYVR